MENYIENTIFDKRDYTVDALGKGDYEKCQFNHCNFNASDLSDINFIECRFNSCNLSRCRLSKTSFRDIVFIGCKMLGLHIEDCNGSMLTMEFDHCVLNYSSFDRLKLNHIKFDNCVLQETSFVGTDLTMAVFSNCDCKDARFENCILNKADFTTAFNFSIDPESNRMKKTRFTLNGLPGLLDKYDIVLE